jgi:hypothetical protein
MIHFELCTTASICIYLHKNMTVATLLRLASRYSRLSDWVLPLMILQAEWSWRMGDPGAVCTGSSRGEGEPANPGRANRSPPRLASSFRRSKERHDHELGRREGRTPTSSRSYGRSACRNHIAWSFYRPTNAARWVVSKTIAIPAFGRLMESETTTRAPSSVDSCRSRYKAIACSRFSWSRVSCCTVVVVACFRSIKRQ